MKIRPLMLCVACLFVLVGCCSFPYNYSADKTVESAKVVLASPTEGEAFLGGSFERFTLNPPVSANPKPKLIMSPVSLPDQNRSIHFGAFVVLHGQDNTYATVYWWSVKGKLRRYSVESADRQEINTLWINERIIRFQFGENSKTVRLNEDDGTEYTEL